MRNNLSELFLLKKDMIFLNHGSFGACPKPVFSAYQNWQLELESQPVDFLHPSRNLVRRKGEVREVLAREFNCFSNEIVGVGNATEGLNIVAQSMELQREDEILTSTHEYSALYKTWNYVAARAGAKIIEVDIPLPLNSEKTFYEAIVSRFSNKTKILFLSHITSETALVFPIGRIVVEAKKRGIITIIDGAHVPGQMALDLHEIGADFYVGNCHKWLMAPKNSGFLFAAQRVQDLLDPLVISHGWLPDTNDKQSEGAFGNSAFVDGIEMQGTQDPSAWLSVPAALSFLAQNNWQQVRADCSELVQESAQRVAKLTGIPPFASPEFCAPQMVSMPIPLGDPVALNRQLLTQYGIEIPVFIWRGQMIARLSVQGYNTREHMDKLVLALQKLLNL